MIECNFFEINLFFDEIKLVDIEFITDLPAGTFAILNVSRDYFDYDEEACSWTLYDEKIEITPVKGDLNGFNRKIDIDKCDNYARKNFDELLSSYSSGIKGDISEEIIFKVTVGLRQKYKAYGKNNCNLFGKYVRDDDFFKYISEEKKVAIQMNKEFYPDINRTGTK